MIESFSSIHPAALQLQNSKLFRGMQKVLQLDRVLKYLALSRLKMRISCLGLVIYRHVVCAEDVHVSVTEVSIAGAIVGPIS